MSMNSCAEPLRETTECHEARSAWSMWLEQQLDVACYHLRRNRLKLAVVMVFAGMFLGCGAPNPIDLASIPDDGGVIQAISANNPLLERSNERPSVGDELDFSDEPRGDLAVPNPDRKNPFEFGGDYAGHGTQGEASTDASSVRLYGFAGESPARAIISAGGRTRMLAAGEKWGVIELLEVNPPQAKIRIDGVSRNLSLLGQGE